MSSKKKFDEVLAAHEATTEAMLASITEDQQAPTVDVPVTPDSDVLPAVQDQLDPMLVNNDGSLGEPWPDGNKPADVKRDEIAKALIAGTAEVLGTQLQFDEDYYAKSSDHLTKDEG